MDLLQTNKENRTIFSEGVTFVLFYMLKSIKFSESSYLCAEFSIINVIIYTTMVNYKDLGLVNTKEMFAKAIKGGYAIPAFNFNNMEQMQAIIKAAVETKSPVILQVSKGARQYANATLLRYMAQGAVEYAKELGCPNPQIVLTCLTKKT